jgi:O-antigen/teichoic acid export membrane protein
MDKIGRKMAVGSVWMLLFITADRSLGFISTIILARLLLPADFGLIAMATSLVFILELFSNLNVDTVLIREAKAERRHYDTAWTFNIVMAMSIACLLVLLANAAAGFYSEPRLAPVMYVLAVAAFAQGFQNIGVVAFRKEMEFHKEFRFLAGKKLAGFLVTIPLAFMWRNYWALVLGIVASRIAGIVLSYYAHPYRPRPSLAARHEIFHFSKWLVANNISNFGRDRASDFVIGRLVGPQALGLYSIAYEIATLPMTELVAPVNRAVFPAYAKLSNDLAELRRRYLQVVSMVAFVALPAAVGIGLTADLFVPLLLGPNWVGAARLIEILAVGGGIGALQSSSWAVFLALGKARTVAFLGLSSLAVMIPLLLFLTLSLGAEGAAFAFLSIMIFLVFVTYALLLKDLALPLRDLLRSFWRPLIAIVVMTAVVLGLRSQWTGEVDVSVQVLHFGVAVTFGAATYAAVVTFLWLCAGRPEGAERLVLDQLWPMVRARLGLRAQRFTP